MHRALRREPAHAAVNFFLSHGEDAEPVKGGDRAHPARTFDAVGRKVDADHLVSAVEIAARLGAKGPTIVYDWRRRHEDFPQPITRLGSVYVWVWPDVEKWARKKGRL